MSKGVVYNSVQSKSHVIEARKSVASVRKFHPDWRVAIHTDRNRVHSEYDDVIPCDLALSNANHPYRAKIEAMIHSPYDETLYLDTDTELRKPIDHVFEVFPDYDMASCYAMGKSYGHTPAYLDCMAEYNAGVIFWKKTKRTDDFFQQWLRYFDENKNLSPPPTDQFSFMLAVHKNPHFRVAMLSIHYNQRHYGTAADFQPAKVEKEAFIVHNRNFIA